jgi:hypothetical protein
MQGTFDGFWMDAYSDPANLTGKTITMHTWIPAQLVAPGYQLLVMMISHSGGVYGNSYNLSDASANAWNAFSYAVPAGIGEDVVGYYGLELFQYGGQPVTGTVYVDDIIVQ